MSDIYNDDRNPLFSLGDIEYQADVAGHGGPLIEPYIDPQSQTSIMYDNDANQTNLLGLMAPERSREEYRASSEPEREEQLVDTKKAFGLAWEGASSMRTGEPVTIEESMEGLRGGVEPSILTFGAKGATASVQSHEFRHIAIDTLRKKEPSEGMTEKQKKALEYVKSQMPSINIEETWNGMFDDYRDTDATWHEQRFMNTSYNQVGGDASKLVDPETLAKLKEARLATLKKRGTEFVKIEAASQIMEGNKAPKGTTWKEYYTQEFEKRYQKIRGALDKITPEYIRKEYRIR